MDLEAHSISTVYNTITTYGLHSTILTHNDYKDAKHSDKLHEENWYDTTNEMKHISINHFIRKFQTKLIYAHQICS